MFSKDSYVLSSIFLCREINEKAVYDVDAYVENVLVQVHAQTKHYDSPMAGTFYGFRATVLAPTFNKVFIVSYHCKYA